MSRTNDYYQNTLEDAGIEIERLEAENKRYKDALLMIGYHPYRKSISKVGWYEEIAQQALKETK